MLLKTGIPAIANLVSYNHIPNKSNNAFFNSLDLNTKKTIFYDFIYPKPVRESAARDVQ